MPLSFYRQLLEALEIGAVVVATVVKTYGSVPREVGAKMALSSEGQILETIGGGAGEAKALKAMEQVLVSGTSQWIAIDLSGVGNTEGVCGGRMEVWLALWQGEEAIALTQRIIITLESGQSLHLFTPFSSASFAYLLSENNAQPTDQEGFIENLNPPPILLIIGAGHVGEKLAQIGHFLGFQIIIQDDRPEWANPQRFPWATQIFDQGIPELLPQLHDHSQLYIALVTRGYTYDIEALTLLLEQPISYQYVGMIGSKKRVNTVKQALQHHPTFAAKLHSLYAPIGLDIGALTPEEIAISIAAELVLVRRGGTGHSLSQLSP